MEEMRRKIQYGAKQADARRADPSGSGNKGKGTQPSIKDSFPTKGNSSGGSGSGGKGKGKEPME